MNVTADGAVTVVVSCLATVPTTAALYPLRAAALLPAPVLLGPTITLVIDQPRQVCLVVNGFTDAPLCVFADPTETFLPADTDPNVIYFGPGTVNAGVINVASGQTVYLAGGAHVFGRIQLSTASAACTGVAVRGRGILDGLHFPIDVNGPSLISLQCSGALIEGVTLLNSPKYQVDTGYPYTAVRWVKAIAWGFSTDGFTGGAQSIIQNSFVKVNDDAIKPYATGTLVEGVVVWQMENGCAVMASWNLNADVAFVTVRDLHLEPERRCDVTVRDVDVIRHERRAALYDPNALLCFIHGGSGNLSHYLFDDIRVDMPGWAAVQLLVEPNPFAAPVGGVLGSIANVTIRNFSAAAAFLAPHPFSVRGYANGSDVTGVVFDTVSTDGGVPVSSALIAVNTSFAAPVTLCAGCSAAYVGADWTEAQKCGQTDSYCRPSRGPSPSAAAPSLAAAAMITPSAAAISPSLIFGSSLSVAPSSSPTSESIANIAGAVSGSSTQVVAGSVAGGLLAAVFLTALVALHMKRKGAASAVYKRGSRYRPAASTDGCGVQVPGPSRPGGGAAVVSTRNPLSAGSAV